MANMRKLGMEFVHMGEFAWAFMEPEEGKYQFDWLEKNVALAAQNGMKVILCTPTATPPIWLSRKHPEILMVDAAGRRMNHGGREQADWSSPVYREYVNQNHHRAGQTIRARPARVGLAARQRTEPLRQAVLLLARGHAPVPRLAAGEVRHHRPAEHAIGAPPSGRMVYQNFDQIEIPNQLDHPGAAESARAAGFQPLVRRRRPPTTCACRPACCASTAPTNGSPPTSWRCTAMSTRRFPAKDLDLFTWTHYPVHGDLSRRTARSVSGWAARAIQSFMHDFMRPINGISGLMELQPGQVNWGAVNPWPLARRDPHVDSCARSARARGSSALTATGSRCSATSSTTRAWWRPTASRRRRAAASMPQAMRDVISSARASTGPTRRSPPRTPRAAPRSSINFDNRWDIDNHKQTTRWDTVEHWMKYYRALKSMMAPVDVVTEDRDLSRYPFVVAPAYQLVDEALVAKWTAYAENGGNLVLTAASGQKDRRGHFPETLWAEPHLRSDRRQDADLRRAARDHRRARDGRWRAL